MHMPGVHHLPWHYMHQHSAFNKRIPHHHGFCILAHLLDFIAPRTYTYMLMYAHIIYICICSLDALRKAEGDIEKAKRAIWYGMAGIVIVNSMTATHPDRLIENSKKWLIVYV